jgi:hypothetical protein
VAQRPGVLGYRRPMLPLRRLALPVLLALGSLAVAGPASADATGTTSSDDVVLFDHCQRHPIHYDLQVAPGTALWRLEIQVFDPGGMVSEGTVLSSAAGAPTSGTVHTTFCGSEPAGTWTVRATGFYELLPAVELPFTLPDTTFRVRPAATRTALTEKPLGHGRHRLTVRVDEQDANGFRRADGVKVRVQRLVDGRWHAVRGTRLTTVHGVARTTLHARPGTKVRAAVPPKNSYAASVSKAVRL